jgi:hypothetical protein
MPKTIDLGNALKKKINQQLFLAVDLIFIRIDFSLFSVKN